MSLNTLAVRQSATGDQDAALATISEAVAIRRALVQANPAAYLPDLAMSLNNLAVQQAAAGDRDTALATSIEAVAIRRALVRTNPAAYLPNLAVPLNTLALRQDAAGDRDTALATITEAVAIRRTLAQANPAAYLPDLAMSLNNLATYQNETVSQDTALASFEEAMTGFGPAAQAELLLARAEWRSAHDPDGAVHDIRRAAEAVAIEPTPATAGQTRRHIRQKVLAWDNGTSAKSSIPGWTYTQIPQRTLDLVNAWLNASSWSEAETLLRSEHEYLANSSSALNIVGFLHPDVDNLNKLLLLLSAFAEHGLEPVLRDQRRLQEANTLVSAWLETPDWNTSRAFLRAHTELLDNPDVNELLSADLDDLESRRHHAILQLAKPLSISAVYDLVIDPIMAVDAAMTAVETGDIERLKLLLAVSPALFQIPFATPFLLAVLTVLTSATRLDLGELIQKAVETGTRQQCEAGALRLRRLADRRHEHSSTLRSLAAILDPLS